MSARAIQRLREERAAAERKEDAIPEEEEEEEEPPEQKKQPAFFAMMDDSSSESEEEEDVENSGNEESEEAGERKGRSTESDTERAAAAAAVTENDDRQTTQEVNKGFGGQRKESQKDNKEKETEEDLDAILAEFQSQDVFEDDSKPSATPWFHVITNDLDQRELDMDFVIRTSLHGRMPPQSRRRQPFLFGPQRDEWTRPPHYVGGGVGMESYANNTEMTPPWPYQSCPEANNPKYWYTLRQSDTYKADLMEYKRVQNSGDVNALALFVSHYPYMVDALLQLTMVLYRTNQSAEGLSLLRRSLWILECWSQSSFRPLAAESFMDHDQPENAPYFLALFRMIQVSHVAGCIRTSLAVSRFLLALDPLRDPLGALLLMDYFALATLNDKHDRFLVDLVESKKVTLHYRDDSTQKEYSGELVELPNWAFSYALALYRLSMAEHDEPSHQCNEALQAAIQKFPTIVNELLIRNEVNVTGRSMRTDWPTVLGNLGKYANCPVDVDDVVMQHAASQAASLVTNIFVQRSHSLWNGPDVLKWLYENCKIVCEKNLQSRPPLCPSLIRYVHCDPSDFDNRFQTLPDDANPFDPNLVQRALVIDPNRGRFRQRGNELAFEEEAAAAAPPAGQGLVVAGPPTQVIDPDDPLLEVLWRSALPWNRVEGVPPPRR